MCRTMLSRIVTGNTLWTIWSACTKNAHGPQHVRRMQHQSAAPEILSADSLALPEAQPGYELWLQARIEYEVA